VAVFGCLKLWSIAEDEIVVRDHPFDDVWYVTSAAGWYWGMPYGQAALTRQAAYPLWIAVAGATGLPLRVATELLLLAAAGALALAFLRAGLPQIPSAAVFGAVAFHPFSFYVNSFALPDSLYAPMLLLGTAGMVTLVARGFHVAAAILTGTALAVLWHTRQESALILGYLALFGLLGVGLRMRDTSDLRAAVRGAFPMVLVPALIVGTSSLAVRLVNLRVFGAFTEYEFASPAFRSAYASLLRIEPEPARPGIPAPREVRRRAYAVSPTFRRLEPFFDGPAGLRWAPGPEGEIGTGTFGWALRDAVRVTGHGDSAREADAFYRRMADEIETACESDRLRCRPVRFGPFDPDVENYVARIPASFLNQLRTLVRSSAAFDRRGTDPIRPDYLGLANEVMNRRAALLVDQMRFTGWAAHAIDPVTAVSFENPEGEVLAVSDRLRSRPDLERYFRTRFGGSAGANTNAAFTLTVPVSSDRIPEGRLVFTLRSGRTLGLSSAQLRRAPLSRLLRLGSGPDALEYAVETREGLEPSPVARTRLQALVQGWYGRVAAGLLAAAALTLVLRVVVRGRRASRVLDAAAILLLGIVLLRVALFAVIDASSWPTMDARFLYPVAPLVPCAALVLLAGNLAAVRSRFGRRR
jgi:hypothetical protein